MRSKKLRKRVNASPPDYVFAAAILLLTLFGVLMVYNTGVVVAHEDFGDKYWFLKNQGMWAFLGITVGTVLSQIDYHVWQKYARPIFWVTIVLLVLVLVPGFSADVYGARRRITLELGLPLLTRISIQPSELAKFSLVLYLATWLSETVDPQGKLEKLSTIKPFLTVLGIVVGLVMLEPDLGTSIIISGSALMVYFLSGVPLIDVVVVALLLVGGAAGFAFSSPYRRERIAAFLNPTGDNADVSYHINQILIALGSGGLLGLGLGQSRQKFQYIPEVTTDSIFAVIGEEMGFLGAFLILGMFLFVVWRGFLIVERCTDRFGKLLASGIISIIALQTFLNLTSVVGLTPLTGLPLPFISYGGSSLTVMLASVGVLVNISKDRRDNTN